MMTEMKARAGEAMSHAQNPGAEVKSAMAGFLKEFNGFQDEVKTAFQQQEDRMTMLDRKTMTYGRPALSAAAEVDVPHKKAFNAYLRSGDDDGLRGLVLEGKAMNTAVAADGGYLVDPQTADSIRSMLMSTSSIRGDCECGECGFVQFDVLMDRTEVGSGWATRSGGCRPRRAHRRLSAFRSSCMSCLRCRRPASGCWMTARLTWKAGLAGKIATRFIRAESAAFVSGDGVDKPKGFLLPTKGCQCVLDLGQPWLCARRVRRRILRRPMRRIASSIWSMRWGRLSRQCDLCDEFENHRCRAQDEGCRWALLVVGRFGRGEPARLMGYPVLIAEDMPDIAANAYAIAFGDFNAATPLPNAPICACCVTPSRAKPHVLFYATKRVGGDVSDFAAIKLLKFAVS